MKSKLFTIDFRDVVHGLFVAFLTAVLTGIIEMLQNGGEIFTWTAIKPVLIAGICAALSYLVKCFGTNSRNQLFTREPMEAVGGGL